jgi:hypothetical protein
MSETLLSQQVNTETATEETKETQSTEESTTEQSTEVKTEETKVEESKEEKTEEQNDEKPEGAPEKYELTVPEGLTLNEAGLEKVTGLFKELNLTNEQAQRLVNAEGEYIKELAQKQNEAWQQTVDGWKEDTTKEFGTKLQEELSNVARVFNQFATPEEAQALKEDLEWSGLGNKKEWVRFLSKIGKQLAEDKLVEAKTSSSASDDPYGKLYPSMKDNTVVQLGKELPKST